VVTQFIPSSTRLRRAAVEPPFIQFVVLSLLFHVLVIVVFGEPEPGGASRRGGWRSLPFAVTLRSLATEEGSVFKASRGADQGAAGSALARRAGAATGGQPTPSPRPRELRPVPPPSGDTDVEPPGLPPALPPPSALPAAEPPAPREAPPADALPRVDPGATDVVDKIVDPRGQTTLHEAPAEMVPRVDLDAARKVVPESAPTVRLPAPIDVPAPAPPRPEVSQPAKFEPESIPREGPARGDAPAEAPPRFEREAPPKVEPAVVPAVPLPVTREAPLEAPPRFEPEAPPKADTETTVPAESTPREKPLEAPAERGPAVPSKPEPGVAPSAQPAMPRDAPAATMPREVPPMITPPVAAEPGRTIERAIAPPAQPPVPREAPALAPHIEGGAPRKVDADSTRPPTPREAPGVEPLPRLQFGTPSDADDVFKPRTPSAGDVPTGRAPRLDLDSTRKPGRDGAPTDSRRTSVVPLNLSPPPPEPESKLGRAIQKAAQPDCRDAYAGMGLLAIPFLLKDTVTDTGCRW
jgi:hypothetical protein